MPKYNWVARYADGSTFEQYNADGTENGYTSIDHNKLESFAIIVQFDDGKRAKLFHLHLDEGQRLIYRRRVWKHVDGTEEVVLMVGRQEVFGYEYQGDMHYENSQAIAYIFPDHHVELAGTFRENHPVFDPPKKSVLETHLEDWPGCRDESASSDS